MLIDIASPSEVAAIAALVNAAYRGKSAARGWTHEAGLIEGQRTDAGTLRAGMAQGRKVPTGRGLSAC